MKLDRRVVALGAVAALTFGMPTAAHAGSGHSKGKATAAQQKAAAKAKADAAKKKKAEEARWHAAVPGTVSAVGASSLTVTRKQRGVTVDRALELAPNAVVKLDGAQVPLSAVQVGDHVVAHLRKVGGAVRVVKLNVERATTTPVPATPTATILI